MQFINLIFILVEYETKISEYEQNFESNIF